MNKSKFLSIICLSLCIENSFSQTGITNFLPKPFPSSPEVAAITKYGNYDVNLYTGIPNISIPLYEIQVGELKVPVSLDYHASGIKVSETASWAGLGWTLSAGGVISRKLMGRPDEQGGGYLTEPTVKIYSDINPRNQADLDYLRFVSAGSKDTELDIYSYHFPGKSGKFVFNQQNGNQPILLPYDPIKVTRTGASTTLSITDERGVFYKFGTTEWTDGEGVPTGTNAISSWLLSEMISANRQDTINFQYTARIEAGTTESYFTDYIILNDQVNNIGSVTYYSPDLGIPYSSTSYSSTWWQTPTTITFKGGKLVFEQATDSREDFFPSGNIMRKRLSRIKVYNHDALTGNYKLLKTIQFNHSYFINGTDASTKRLRLDEVIISGTDGVAIEKYRFEYNLAQMLPVKSSKAIDLWGYYNNIPNNILVPQMTVPYQDFHTGTPINYTIGSNYANGRDPDPNYMQACILKRINHPTGGFTDFEYETNKYFDNTVKYAGGLRIAKIKSYDGIKPNPTVKTYKYGAGESGYGRKNFVLNNYFFQNTQTQRYFRQPVPPEAPGCPALKATKRVRTFFASPTIEIEPYDGSPVAYPVVTEYMGDEITNTGRTIYQFNDLGDVVNMVAAYGKPIINSYHFNRGQLIDKETQKTNADGSYIKVAKTTNAYTYFTDQWNSNIGLVVFKQIISQDQFNDDLALAPDEPGNLCAAIGNDSYSYQYGNYAIRGGDNKLTSTTDIVYDQYYPLKYVTTNTTYTYDDITHLQVKQTQTTGSKGQTLLSLYKYPHDYTVSPYTSMAANNIISKIVEETRTGNGNLISLQKSEYGNVGNNNFLPVNIQFKQGAYPIETRALFNSYDSRGNILEMQKSGDAKQTFIWDYLSLYPVAQVTNASQIDIAYTSFEANGKGNWTFTGTAVNDPTSPTGKKCYILGNSITKSGLSTSGTYIVSYWKKSGAVSVNGTTAITGRTVNGWTYYEHQVNPAGGVITVSGTNGFLDELRLYPTNTQMTTYTYEPLIGITSQCDANNRITYYEYDDFMRLMLIRDQDKNIVKQVCYNHSGQLENCSIFYNSQKFGMYTKACVPGYFSNPVTYTVPEKTYSASTQSAADQKAQDDVAANGQNYANANGVCSPGITINGYNSMTQNYNLQFTNTEGVFNFTLPANTCCPNYIGVIPSGYYTVQFSPLGSPLNATFNINGLTYYGTGASFSNVNITNTSTASIY